LTTIEKTTSPPGVTSATGRSNEDVGAARVQLARTAPVAGSSSAAMCCERMPAGRV
jgi:hypothetical protein